MKNIGELKKAVAEKKQLVWNDPDPIPDNDYNITYVEPLDDFDDDENYMPILIQYGAGSEAEVFVHEILTKL